MNWIFIQQGENIKSIAAQSGWVGALDWLYIMFQSVEYKSENDAADILKNKEFYRRFRRLVLAGMKKSDYFGIRVSSGKLWKMVGSGMTNLWRKVVRRSKQAQEFKKLKPDIAIGGEIVPEPQPAMWSNAGLFQFGVRVNF